MKSTSITIAICCAAALFQPALRAETVFGEPDAYLDYIEATGSQYIDTGVNAQTGLKARIDMSWADGGTSCDWGFLGARKDTSTESRLFLYHGNANSSFFGGSMAVAYGYGSFGRPAKNVDYNVRHEIVSDFTDNAAIQIYLNGAPKISANDQASRAALGPFDLGINLYLFAVNKAGVPDYYGKGKLYELKIFEKNDTTGELDLIRHYLPCKKDNRAALYDKVNGTVSFSYGSADFVAGPELPRPAAMVEWVEADGATSSGVAQQYVDTGVIGKIGLKSAVDLTLLEDSGDHAILASRGAGSSTNYRLYLAYHYSKYFCYGDGKLREPKNLAPTNGVRYLIESDLSATAQSVKVNGVELYKDSFTDTAYFTTSNSLALFANNHYGAYVKNPSHSRLYSAKIWDGDELLRDFAPCVADDGEAGLYDAVTERVFKPSKAFALATQVGAITNVLVDVAAPKTRLEYVDSDGASDYVNLGIIGKDGVEMDAVMEWLVVPKDGAFVSSRVDSPTVQRFNLYNYWPSNGQNPHRIGYGGALRGASTTSTAAATANRKYWISSRLDDGDQLIAIKYQDDGAWAWESNEGGRATNDAGPVDTGLPLYLFAGNHDGKPDYFGSSRVYSLKLRVKQQDGSYAPAREFVPVRDPLTGGAALWDKVSETYFRNGGRYLLAGSGEERDLTGPFVLVVR